mmetsp:Transcript_25189/g.41974  ORF Transcript_25189/g.41974 Transcript_25189/m.41974 type:complete len:483 (+) Transcript_25189:186-1634(+)
MGPKSKPMNDGTWMKPKVGIIFSQTDQFSGESANLAAYFCGLLSETGYCDLYMIGYESTGVGNVVSRRIRYTSAGQSKPKEVPAADVTFAHFSALQDCHVLIITVNSNDTKSCCQKLRETFNQPKGVTVFSLQRGVRNSLTVKEELDSSKGFTVMECVVGFAAVLDPKHSAVHATSPNPSILFERLSKEAVQVADGPTRLLESMDLTCHFRKTLTPHSWGVLLFETLCVLNILTKGSLQDTLSKREWRLILALMVRESYKVLTKAAKGGKWKPDLTLLNPSLSSWLLEMMLVMPDALFWSLFWFYGLVPDPTICSPGQLDLMEGRKSMAVDWHFAELVSAGQRHRYDAPVSTIVLQQLQALEASLFPHLVNAASGNTNMQSQSSSSSAGASDSSSTITYHNTDHMARLQLLLEQGVVDGDGDDNGNSSSSNISKSSSTSSSSSGNSLLRNHPSMVEVWYWISRVFGIISTILLIAFLFLHDY